MPAAVWRVFARHVAELTGSHFVPAENYFEALSSQDTAVELWVSSKVLRRQLMKIANDLRWMTSGPLRDCRKSAAALQPGSSICRAK